MPELNGVIRGVLDSFVLIGILLTAIFSIFKSGRWFEGMMGSIMDLTESFGLFRKDFDKHIADEDRRFLAVDATLEKHTEKIETMHGAIEVIKKNMCH